MSTVRPLVVSALAVSALVAGGVMAQPAGGRGGQPGGQPGVGGGFSAERFVDRMMESDANGDGKLSRDEMPGRFADQMFDGADSNADGLLDRDELTKFAEERFANRGGGAFRPGGAGGDGSSVHDQMERAGRAARGLRDSAMNADTLESDLAQLGVIQASLIVAKNESASIEMSAQAKERYGQDEAAYRHDLRVSVIEAIERSLEMERALIDGESDRAREHFQKLLDARNAAHKVFKEDV